jgi:tricorn protease
MLAMFYQPEHSFTIPRDGPKGYPIDRRPLPAWNKPMVILCNEDTFSNAEIFCHAIQHLKRAPLVGIATAGGVISAVKTSIPDMGELQIPFRGWYDATTGENFDSRGAQPDHRVDLTPADEDAGRDPQLDKALELLKGR